MVKIILVRHGYSVTNKSGCLTGRLDVPLDEIGKKQAVLLSEYLRENFKIDAIYSSDLIRVTETVRPLSEALKIEIRTLELLRETNIGRWQGKCLSQLSLSEPELVTEMRNDPYNFRFPEGECENDVYTRAIEAIRLIVSENEGKTVVVATHGGVIRSLLRNFLNVPPERTDLLPLANNASVSVIEYENGVFTPKEIGLDHFLADLSTAYKFK